MTDVYKLKIPDYVAMYHAGELIRFELYHLCVSAAGRLPDTELAPVMAFLKTEMVNVYPEPYPKLPRLATHEERVALRKSLVIGQVSVFDEIVDRIKDSPDDDDDDGWCMLAMSDGMPVETTWRKGIAAFRRFR